MLAKADSKPISLAVLDMMKFSNNYVAEMLAKTLSVHSGKIPGTLEDGMRVIRESIVKIGIPENRFTLINPSGLNRRNQMKPVDLAKVLVEGFNHFPTFSEFVTSFPLSGLDGTLKSRMKE